MYHESSTNSTQWADRLSSTAVLLGSNLDDGDEFMYLTPPNNYAMAETQYHQWLSMFFGANSSAATLAPTLYSLDSLARPFLNCSTKAPVCQNWTCLKPSYYLAGVRTAGDYGIACPVRRLAAALSRVQGAGTNLSTHAATSASHASGGVYLYSFEYAPTKSVNWDSDSIKYLHTGAFHGAGECNN
jgi:hypothetical protein